MITLNPGETRQINVALTPSPTILFTFKSLWVILQGTYYDVPITASLNTSARYVIEVQNQSNLSATITVTSCFIDPDGIQRLLASATWTVGAGYPGSCGGEEVVLDKPGAWYVWAKIEGTGVIPIESQWHAINVS